MMITDKIINLLVVITLAEMMITLGMSLTVNELTAITRDRKLLAKAVLANYLCVPAAAVGLLLFFRVQSMAAAGILILAVCPGGPYGPPCTAIAKGNVSISVGLMVVLAGSSAIMAPLLLPPLVSLVAGEGVLQISGFKILMALLASQLLPLCGGLMLRHKRPVLAERLFKPAERLSMILNVLTCGVVLVVQFQLLREIPVVVYVTMLALLLVSFGTGWSWGGAGSANRRTMTLVTSVRNVAVSLAIVTRNFPGTSAVSVALAYGVFQILGSLLLAVWWGRRSIEGAESLPR